MTLQWTKGMPTSAMVSLSLESALCFNDRKVVNIAYLSFSPIGCLWLMGLFRGKRPDQSAFGGQMVHLLNTQLEGIWHLHLASKGTKIHHGILLHKQHMPSHSLSLLWSCNLDTVFNSTVRLTEFKPMANCGRTPQIVKAKWDRNPASKGWQGK